MVRHRAAFAGRACAERGATRFARGNTRICVKSAEKRSVERRSRPAASIGWMFAILTWWNRTVALTLAGMPLGRALAARVRERIATRARCLQENIGQRDKGLGIERALAMRRRCRRFRARHRCARKGDGPCRSSSRPWHRDRHTAPLARASRRHRIRVLDSGSTRSSDDLNKGRARLCGHCRAGSGCREARVTHLFPVRYAPQQEREVDTETFKDRSAARCRLAPGGRCCTERSQQ